MVRVVGFLVCTVVWVAAAPLLAAPAAPLSPHGVVELRCPTFSWSQAAGASGYELVVYAVSEVGEVAEIPVLTTRLPAGASSWTPSGARCLEAGGSYAWSVRAVGSEVADVGPEASLFRVAAAPSLAEVEGALETLRRHLRETRSGEELIEEGARAEIAAAERRLPGEALAQRLREAEAGRPGDAEARRLREMEASRAGAVGRQSVAPASAPTLGDPSLTVGGNVSFGPESNLFKDQEPFLWDDPLGNTALGRQALASTTHGPNTAVGRNALTWNTTGSDNTAIGTSALFSNTTGIFNTATGTSALSSNTSGMFNTATGRNALSSNTEGERNTATGMNALSSNTEGHNNTATGTNALFLNETGSDNTASGFVALRNNTEGNRNTATGTAALFSNTTGSFNTAMGNAALYSNQTGYQNTAIGNLALLNNEDGTHNTAAGAFVLRLNTTGYRNTASGFLALEFNETGSRNTAMGNAALRNNSSGTHNTASGNLALLNNTVGSRNTAVGHYAGGNATTGDDNIYIGSGALGVADEANTIRIGGATGDDPGEQNRTFIAGIHQGVLTGSDEHTVCVDDTGQLGVCGVSSATFKEQVEALGGVGERLADLRPVSFRYREGVLGGPERTRVGLIAEEVAELFPELVVRDAQGEPFGVRYELLSVLLLAELQRDAERLSAQERKLAGQRAKLTMLQERLATLERDGPGDERRRWWQRPARSGQESP